MKPLSQIRQENKEEAPELFHDLYETLAPAYGYETRPETKVFDRKSVNGKLMTAVSCEVVALSESRIIEAIREWAESNFHAGQSASEVGSEYATPRHYERDGRNEVLSDLLSYLNEADKK